MLAASVTRKHQVIGRVCTRRDCRAPSQVSKRMHDGEEGSTHVDMILRWLEKEMTFGVSERALYVDSAFNDLVYTNTFAYFTSY